MTVKRKTYQHRYNLARRDKQRNYQKTRYTTDSKFRENEKKKRREYKATHRLEAAKCLREWRHRKGISKKFNKTKTRESLSN